MMAAAASRCRVDAERALLDVERLEARASAREDKAETCAAVVDVGQRCGGGVLHEPARPRSSCQASNTARARSRSEAKQVWPPAAANRAIKLSCASLGRPPSDFNSNAKPSSPPLQQCGHAPGRNRSTSATPATTPRPFTPGAARARKCWKTAR